MTEQLELVEPHVVWLMRMHREQFTEEFIGWLPNNMHVWIAFERETLRVIARGFKHYSARTIVHFLRHHSAVAENAGEGWKINNNHSPYLARLYDLVHPTQVGLWEYRETKAVKEDAFA